MKRIHIHWTAGAPGISPKESDSYHYVVERDGAVHACVPVANNVPPLVNGAYAAHTRRANSWAIGVAMDAMAGAKEVPFTAGPYPITDDQYRRTVKLVGELAKKYGIKVSRETVLTHAEVETTLGIKQNSKWDVMWIPGMAKPGDPIKVGDMIRADIRASMAGKKPKQRGEPKKHWLSALIEAILAVFANLSKRKS